MPADGSPFQRFCPTSVKDDTPRRARSPTFVGIVCARNEALWGSRSECRPPDDRTGSVPQRRAIVRGPRARPASQHPTGRPERKPVPRVPPTRRRRSLLHRPRESHGRVVGRRGPGARLDSPRHRTAQFLCSGLASVRSVPENSCRRAPHRSAGGARRGRVNATRPIRHPGLTPVVRTEGRPSKAAGSVHPAGGDGRVAQRTLDRGPPRPSVSRTP